MGINYATLVDLGKKRKTKDKKEKSTAEPNTVEEMQKEIAELRKANEILKDALGFFTLDRKK